MELKNEAERLLSCPAVGIAGCAIVVIGAIISWISTDVFVPFVIGIRHNLFIAGWILLAIGVEVVFFHLHAKGIL